MPVLFGGHNLLPLVEIGLTDLPKSRGAMAPPGTRRDDTPACCLGFEYILIYSNRSDHTGSTKEGIFPT